MLRLAGFSSGWRDCARRGCSAERCGSRAGTAFVLWRSCGFHLRRLCALARRGVRLVLYDSELRAVGMLRLAGCSSGWRDCARGCSARRCSALTRRVPSRAWMCFPRTLGESANPAFPLARAPTIGGRMRAFPSMRRLCREKRRTARLDKSGRAVL